MNEILAGKVKTVYEAENPDEVLIKFHDKVTAGNGEKEDNPDGKGAINCKISAMLFRQLEKAGVFTHYIDMVDDTIMLCKKVRIIPLEVVVRNIAAGSIVRQTPFDEGLKFSNPLVEFYLKDDSKNDPLLTLDRVRLMGYDPKPFITRALKINNTLKAAFYLIGLNLVDFKVEFGYTSDGRLLLADEISPDGCRLWKIGTHESMDKDLFRNDTGDIINAYQKILDDLSDIISITDMSLKDEETRTT